MKLALSLFAILCGILWAWGFMSAPRDRVTVRARQEGRYTQITVVMPSMNVTYRWLSVHLCSAEVAEDGVTFCSGHFERESTMELDGRRGQVYVEWRDIPGRTVLVTAMAFDAEGRVLASGQTTVFLR